MSSKGSPIHILLAEDDADDRLMIEDALKDSRLKNKLHCVVDGVDLMDYLYNRNKYSDPIESPRPGLILLDLNMPRKDGREALEEIKADPVLRRIPVIALTTSNAEKDVMQSYNLGVNSFIVKPVTFDELVKICKSFTEYWFEIVELPSE